MATRLRIAQNMLFMNERARMECKSLARQSLRWRRKRVLMGYGWCPLTVVDVNSRTITGRRVAGYDSVVQTLSQGLHSLHNNSRLRVCRVQPPDKKIVSAMGTTRRVRDGVSPLCQVRLVRSLSLDSRSYKMSKKMFLLSLTKSRASKIGFNRWIGLVSKPKRARASLRSMDLQPALAQLRIGPWIRSLNLPTLASKQHATSWPLTPQNRHVPRSFSKRKESPAGCTLIRHLP